MSGGVEPDIWDSDYVIIATDPRGLSQCAPGHRDVERSGPGKSKAAIWAVAMTAVPRCEIKRHPLHPELYYSK